MSDDYLWDPKAEPDPDVERLERALGVLRYVEKPALAEAPSPKPIPISQARRRRVTFSRVLLLAAALGALGAVWYAGSRRSLPIEAGKGQEAVPEPGPKLAVERLEGAPKVGAAKIDALGALSVGQWLE